MAPLGALEPCGEPAGAGLLPGGRLTVGLVLAVGGQFGPLLQVLVSEVVKLLAEVAVGPTSGTLSVKVTLPPPAGTLSVTVPLVPLTVAVLE